MRALLFGLGLPLILAVASAEAQDAPQSASQEQGIVVTGQTEITPKIVHRYVRQISSSVDGQLTRFREPVCPGVVGFEERYNVLVAQRIRAVAVAAGVKLAGADCRANLVVVIAADADALVRTLRVKRPGTFAGVDDAALHRAFEDGPVHVWNSTEILNEDGEHQIGRTLYVKSASIIDLPTQQAVAGSMVVIDRKAALGKTLTQIADYAAMRALAGARPPKQGVSADTILTLFDPQVTPPPHATTVDQSYLQGIYEARATARDINAKSVIARRILKNSQDKPAKD